MRTLVVYFSRFGNTRRLAEAMAETMQQAGDVRVIPIDRLSTASVAGVDLVVVGSPTHGFTVPEEVRNVLEDLPRGVLTGKLVAAFDTTVKLWPLRDFRASPGLLGHLSRLGGHPIAKPETFFVQTRNPQKSGEIDLLLAGELERARKWAAGLLE